MTSYTVTVKTDNELIAEFMGVRSRKQVSPFSDLVYNEVKLTANANWQTAHYQSSWDWLMPVVEKIAKDYDFTIQFYAGDCIAYVYKQNIEQSEITSYGNFEPAILNVYRAVVEFIHWHNSQKK